MQTLGSLHPHTLALELPVFSRPMLEDSLADGCNNEPARVYAHELQHWFDIVGTLWGQRYLDLVFSAFDAVLAANTEDLAYPEVLRLFDADREILFPRYYKYVLPGAPHGATKKWINRWSAGYRIRHDGTRDNGYPILFVRLETNEGVFARQPLSIGALLELRAMAAEDAVFNAFLPALADGERTVERAIRTRALVQQLYDPLLTTYSAAAHVLSTSSGDRRVEPVFAWGAALADLCLNIDSLAVRKLKPPSGLAEFGHQIIHGFRSRADPGFLYACVIAWLHENRPLALDAGGLDTALNGVGMSSSGDLYRQAEQSLFRRAMPTFRSDRLRALRTALREAGGAILRAKSTSAGIPSRVSWHGLPSPMVMTDDAEQFHLGQKIVGVEDTDWLHDCQCRFDVSLRQALRAGRGLDFGFTDFTY
jgi:hypothetical protein